MTEIYANKLKEVFTVLSKIVQEKVEQLVRPYILAHGFELVDVVYVKEGGKYFLRIFVDKEGGIDIEDCSRISEYVSEKLDEEDPIPNAYFLEVSSPGAERPLKKKEDFLRSIGKYVWITTYETIDGSKQFEGTLTAYNDEEAIVQVGSSAVRLPIEKIASARLAIQF